MGYYNKGFYLQALVVAENDAEVRQEQRREWAEDMAMFNEWLKRELKKRATK